MMFIQIPAKELPVLLEQNPKWWESWFVVKTPWDITLSQPHRSSSAPELGIYFQPRNTGPIITLDEVLEMHRVVGA